MNTSGRGLIQITAIAIILIVVGKSFYNRFNSTGADAAEETVAVVEPDDTQHKGDPNDTGGKDDVTTDPHDHGDDVPGRTIPTADDVRNDPIGSLVGIGFDVAHTATRVGNDMLDKLVGLSVKEEIEIGREAFEETTSRHKVIQDAQQISRIERLAAPFVAARERKQIQYTFTIIDDDAVNAFAHLGGYVYVNRGLLDAAKNDDELEFVLGHEVAHVDRRHCVKNMTVILRAQQATGGLGATLAGVAYQAISVGYSEDFELDSDAWSYAQMRARGRSHEQSLKGLRMLERVFGPDGDHHAHGPVVIKHIEEHFETHPRISDRIAALDTAKNRR